MTPRATSAASLVEALRLIAIESAGNPKGGMERRRRASISPLDSLNALTARDEDDFPGDVSGSRA